MKEKQKVYYICKEEFSTDEHNKNAFKRYHKSEIIVIIQENLERLFIAFTI